MFIQRTDINDGFEEQDMNRDTCSVSESSLLLCRHPLTRFTFKPTPDPIPIPLWDLTGGPRSSSDDYLLVS